MKDNERLTVSMESTGVLWYWLSSGDAAREVGVRRSFHQAVVGLEPSL